MVLIALSIGACGATTRPLNAAADDSKLADLLARMSRVAGLYRDMALKFECTETIDYKASEDWRPPSGYAKFSYLYERGVDGKFEDCRLWSKSGGKGKLVRCVKPDEYRIPLYLSNAYLWIFAFQAERQPWHEYRMTGEETVRGRPSVVVDYGPRDAIRPEFNDWYGRAWIDRENSQLLRLDSVEFSRPPEASRWRHAASRPLSSFASSIDSSIHSSVSFRSRP